MSADNGSAGTRNGDARAAPPMLSEASGPPVVTIRDLAEFWGKALSRLKDIVEREAPKALSEGERRS